MDHGEGAGKQYVCVELLQGRKVYVLREWSGKDATGPADVARAVVDLLTALGVTIHHVKKIIGDVNSAGLAGGGHRYNDLIERALADLLGASVCPVPVTIPSKGKGSVDAGESAMSFAMTEGRFLVHHSCARFIHSARHYTGREKDLKDPVDGVRYGCADRLLAVNNGPRNGTIHVL
jgi:hypothetical protein